ncbi:DNA endonuclease SmrA [Neiella marina]|uniref:DNA endonuclease SmrA n=1 Tax=Neiella holothuriorum TaxID=2870530 RepID=A0ABS7EIT0_9GAMM|nr:DNA endonuclease SmrA [Neiella holothuriorum]MBW8192125.1 DNA endonuclease SmrA [Neiella holothuriorum]
MHDDEQFANFIEGVKPLANADTIPDKHRQMARQQALARQQSATASQAKDDNPLSDEQAIELVDPLDMLEFQRPGVQHGVLKKLRLGHYPSDMKLDLHGHTVAEARQAVLTFINKCQAQQARSAIIVHGMGLKGNPPAKLKSCVNQWLRQLPQVMAFHSCQKADGGLGAVYVLITKSAIAKQHNRERFQQRR